MALAKGTRVTPFLSLAENVSQPQQNRKEFEQLLDEVLAYDVDSHVETRLQNILAQRRARQLKAMADDLFLEVK